MDKKRQEIARQVLAEEIEQAERRAHTVPALAEIAVRWHDELADSDAAKACLAKAQDLTSRSSLKNEIYHYEIASAWLHLGDRQAGRGPVEEYLALANDETCAELCFRAQLHDFLGTRELSRRLLQRVEEKASWAAMYQKLQYRITGSQIIKPIKVLDVTME